MATFLDGITGIFKANDLRAKILFTLAMIFVFRVGAHIPVPGVDVDLFRELISQAGIMLGFFDVISGGAFKSFAVFAMSIIPYINASIIMNLLTVVIPHLEQLSKEGDEGRKKITQYTRYFTVVLAFLQATGMSFMMSNYGVLTNPGVFSFLVIIFTLTAGTTMLMWLGEQITERGIGNGISLLIFAGIVSGLPAGMQNLYLQWQAGTINILNVLLLLVIGGLAISAIVAVQEGQRRIPVQYAKRVVGRRVYGGQSTHLPLKINPAGVIPVIFASSLLMFPEQLAQWFQNSTVANFYMQYFSWTTPAHTLIYALLIIGFTYFYTAVITNPVDMANNIKKYGGFIPGIRPGRPTAEFISRVMNRIVLA